MMDTQVPGSWRWIEPLVEVLAISTKGKVLACLPATDEIVGQSCATVFGPLGARCTACHRGLAEGAEPSRVERASVCLPLAGPEDAMLHVALRPDATARFTEMLQGLQAASRHALAFLVHDMNNILAALRGTAAELAETPGLPEPARQVADELQDLLAAARDLISRFRPSPSGGTPPTARLAESVDLARRICRLTQLETRARLEVRLPPEDVRVAADPSALTEMVTNLLLNALQAAAQGPDEPVVQVEAEAGESAVILAITDNGPGIAPDLEARIFDVSFTTKPHGTGLGLALVRHLAAENRAEVRFESSPAGTRFELVLQRADRPAGSEP